MSPLPVSLPWCSSASPLPPTEPALPISPPPAEYVAVAPSPCEEYRHVYTDDLYSIRRTARLFHRQDVQFHRMKRKRLNDGFEGPDISLNAVMSAEQIQVAFKVTEIAEFVTKARRLSCAAPVRLNQVENEAVRIHHEVAEAAFWVDPVTFR